MAETLRTLCNRDCPDACGLVATVEDGRITRLRGDPEHPVTRGFLCYRTGRFLERQYAADRLTTPLWRESLDAPFRPVTWDEALDRAATTLRAIRAESGPEAIFHYRSGGSLGILDALVDRVFEAFGPVTEKRGDICSGAGDAAQEADFGDSDSHDLFGLLHAKTVLIWGKNVHTSSPHTVPVLKEARERGARLIAIDPVAHRTTAMAHRHWPVRPGGDLALALAVGRLIFERGAVDPSGLANLDAFRALCFARTVAERCAEADLPEAAAAELADALLDRPCAILVGWGMGRRERGGAIVRAVDALSALSGNLGVRGGGASFYFKRRGAFRKPWTAAPPPRTVCEPRFGPELLAMDPPIRAVWVTAGNPVVMLPESDTTVAALRSRELVVVVDTHPTDTTACAHLVLPTTTLLEEDDLVGAYGHHWIGASRPVVAPPPGVRTDLEIAQALAERLGVGEVVAGDARAWKRRFLHPDLAARGVELETLEAGAVRNPLAPEVLFPGGRVATADGRVRLLDAADDRVDPAPEGFPLRLMALSTDKSQSSQQVEPLRGLPPVTVHPDVAPAGPARLRSVIGALDVEVRHDPRQRRDVALMAKGGGWAAGHCANRLVRARLTDLGEGGALYDEWVRVEPA